MNRHSKEVETSMSDLEALESALLVFGARSRETGYHSNSITRPKRAAAAEEAYQDIIDLFKQSIPVAELCEECKKKAGK